MFQLKDKVAVVTGGNSGIGLAVAECLAEAGASVAIWGRSSQRNTIAHERLNSISDAEHSVVECDVSDEDQVEAAYDETLSRYGRLDICVANAGYWPPAAKLCDYPTQLWRETLAVDLDGVFFTLRGAARRMGESGGAICVISSVAALEGSPRYHAYAAAKAGTIGLVRSTAVELARQKIRVNAVLPGWTETPTTNALLHRADDFNVRWRNAVMQRIPLQRWGDPQDIAGAVLYLVSDASRYHTGDALVVDGGYSVF